MHCGLCQHGSCIIFLWSNLNWNRCIGTKCKSWKSWLSWAICAIFSSCKKYWRKYQPSKTAKLLCGKKVMRHAFSVKFRVFRRAFLRNHSMYWAQIFRDNWNFYALSIFRVFILLASSDSDKHMLMRHKG